MKANSNVRPYKGVVLKNGTFTKYAVQQSKHLPDGSWKEVGWLSVMIKGGTEIPEKNPDGIKLHIDSIQGVDLDEYNGKLNITVWAEGHTEGGEPASKVPFAQLDEELPF